MQSNIWAFSFILLFFLPRPLDAQTVILSDQNITAPQYFFNKDTLKVLNCTFEDITGEALRFEKIGYVQIENCTFSNVANTIPTRGAVCGRECNDVTLRNLRFSTITGTAIRFPIDGASELSQRLGTVRIDSVHIENTLTNGSIHGSGILVFHTDSLYVLNSTLKNIGLNGISLGRNDQFSTQTQYKQRVGYCEISSVQIDSVLGDGINAQENVEQAFVFNNQISNVAYDGVGGRPTEGDHGIYWQASGGRLEHNRIFKVHDGLVSGKPGSGISLRTDALVNGNIIFECTGNGIGYFNDHPGWGMLQISNNLLYDNLYNGIYINGSNWDNINPAKVRRPDSLFILHNTVFNQQIQPNPVHSCPLAVRDMNSTNLLAGNLLVFEDFADTSRYIRFIEPVPSKQRIYNFLIPTDPGFVDFANRDFHLQKNSPAVDFIPVSHLFVTHDLEGEVRTGPHDAGAFEYQAPSSTRPEPLDTLKYFVYPNPFKTGFDVVSAEGAERLYLYDLYGKQVWSGTTANARQIPNLPTGNYILFIEDNVARAVIRLVKQ